MDDRIELRIEGLNWPLKEPPSPSLKEWFLDVDASIRMGDCLNEKERTDLKTILPEWHKNIRHPFGIHNGMELSREYSDRLMAVLIRSANGESIEDIIHEENSSFSYSTNFKEVKRMRTEGILRCKCLAIQKIKSRMTEDFNKDIKTLDGIAVTLNDKLKKIQSGEWNPL